MELAPVVVSDEDKSVVEIDKSVSPFANLQDEC